jgi:hypothetical protein
MFAADLRTGVNPVVKLPHYSGERIKRFAPRLSCEMRATQLIADPLKIGLKLCISAHRSLPRHFDPHSHFDPHIRAFPAGNISCLLPSRAAGRASNPVG